MIEIVIRNKVASLKNPQHTIVCDNSDYVLRFDFDEEWSALRRFWGLQDEDL